MEQEEGVSEMGDPDFDYEEPDEGSEWCDRCQGLGEVACECGGDFCCCGHFEITCPRCDGEGWWTPTPAQLAAREEHARWWAELHASLEAIPPAPTPPKPPAQE
jgi:hypothetical protein